MLYICYDNYLKSQEPLKFEICHNGHKQIPLKNWTFKVILYFVAFQQPCLQFYILFHVKAFKDLLYCVKLDDIIFLLNLFPWANNFDIKIQSLAPTQHYLVLIKL